MQAFTINLIFDLIPVKRHVFIKCILVNLNNLVSHIASKMTFLWSLHNFSIISVMATSRSCRTTSITRYHGMYFNLHPINCNFPSSLAASLNHFPVHQRLTLTSNLSSILTQNTSRLYCIERTHGTKSRRREKKALERNWRSVFSFKSITDRQ